MAPVLLKRELRTPPDIPLTGPTTSCPYPHPLTRVPAKAGGSLLFQGDTGSIDLDLDLDLDLRPKGNGFTGRPFQYKTA